MGNNGVDDDGVLHITQVQGRQQTPYFEVETKMKVDK